MGRYGRLALGRVQEQKPELGGKGGGLCAHKRPLLISDLPCKAEGTLASQF